MELTDAELVEQVQAGRTEAFGELVKRHSRYLFGAAYRVTGNETLAEDVVQDTFLKAFEQIGRFDFRAQFTTWTYRIAVNRAIDLMRRKSHSTTRGLEPEESEDRLGASEEPDQHRLLQSRELSSRTAAVLETLSPMERTSFVLRHVEGRSIAEIGAVLDTRTSATKHAIFRAVRKLRAALEPYVEADHEAAV